jgi:alkylation response protein AidB-like acyl-CoA dehydrogenase
VDVNEAEIKERVAAFLAEHDPSGDRLEFLRARFDAGLAWVWFPEGLGGLGVARELQQVVERELAGTPQIDTGVQGIGLGMAAPTILVFGTEEQKRRFLVPALQRAGRRIGPGHARDQGGQGRGRMGRGRPEGVDVRRPSRAMGHPRRPYRP